MGQAQKLELAERVVKAKATTKSSPTDNEKRREKKLLLLEQAKKKLEEILSSPQYQQRMRNSLLKINQRLIRQQTFLTLISKKDTRQTTCRQRQKKPRNVMVRLTRFA